MPRREAGANKLKDRLSSVAASGQSWLRSEAELAKAHVKADASRFLKIAFCASLGLGFMISTLVLGALFFAALLAPLVGGLAKAAALLAGVMAVLAGLSIVIAYRMLHGQSALAALWKRWSSLQDQGKEALHGRH